MEGFENSVFAAAGIFGAIDEAKYEIMDESKYEPGYMTEDSIFVLARMEKHYIEHKL